VWQFQLESSKFRVRVAHCTVQYIAFYILCLHCVCTDAKVSGGAAPLRIDEIAYNAVAVVWNTRDKRVKVTLFANSNIIDTSNSHKRTSLSLAFLSL